MPDAGSAVQGLRDLIVFGEDWGAHPSSTQHLIRHLAPGRRVVEVILSRAGEVGAALIVATHDLSVAERLPIRWSMENRRLETGVALRSA